jgi:GT2 family glycosyltransferase
MMWGVRMASTPPPRAEVELDHPGSLLKVAVVVVNWNGWSHTIECLESVQRTTYPSFEIIVVDNGSSDGSIDRIKAWARGEITVDSKYLDSPASRKPVIVEEYDVGAFPPTGTPELRSLPVQQPPAPRVLLIKVGENRGFAGGNNVGIRWALARGAEFVFLINNDAIAEPNVLAELVAQAGRESGVGMVAPTVVSYADPSVVDRQGIVLTKAGLPYERKSAADGPLLCPDGCAALYSRALLLSVACGSEYFDEDFFAYGEDVDLGLRARHRGFSAALVEHAVVYHKIGGSQGGPLSPMSVYLRHRNTIWMLAKDFPFRCLVKNAPWILAGQLGTLAWNLLGPGWRPVLKGKIDGARGILRMWRKRHACSSEGTNPNVPLDGRLFLSGRRGHVPFTKSEHKASMSYKRSV